MATGWTWEYVGEHMDIPRLRKMQHYWEENPPLHVLVASYMGVGVRKDKKQSSAGAEMIIGMGPSVPAPQPRPA